MNSKQRRQHRKRWQYQVSTVTDYDGYCEMWDWLKNQHGVRHDRCGWRDHIDWEHIDMKITWCFVREKDASYFAMRWA